MEPPDFESLNITAQPTAFTHPVCERWRDGSEGSVFHLANIFLVLGFMGGSGLYGLLYLFTFLTLGFFCSTIWSWSDPCTTDTFLWTFALFGASLGQTLHVSYRLRSVTFEKEFEDLYNFMFKKLGVSLTQYGKIVACCERDVQTLERDHCFAVEGKTAIDKLTVLLTGRIRVSVNGEFLHYIYPFQFLDSPEWDSLRPSEEGIFQVTLRAENRCRYVTWRRKKLYLLFAKHRYLAKIFALVVRNDIADKLYSLNDKAFDSSGHRYDLRLPSFCHPPTLTTDPEGLLLPPTPSAGQDKPRTRLRTPSPASDQDKPETHLHPRSAITEQDKAEVEVLLLPPTPSDGQNKPRRRQRIPTPVIDQDKPEQDKAEGQPHPTTLTIEQDNLEEQLHPLTSSSEQDGEEESQIYHETLDRAEP